MPKGGLRSTSFKPGKSGNPSGRPKLPEAIEARRIIADVKALAQECAPEAIAALKEIFSDAKAPPAARVSAATAILDRGYGKPTATVEADVNQRVTLETLVMESYMLSREKLEPPTIEAEELH
jgi:hypothetical protein